MAYVSDNECQIQKSTAHTKTHKRIKCGKQVKRINKKKAGDSTLKRTRVSTIRSSWSNGSYLTITSCAPIAAASDCDVMMCNLRTVSGSRRPILSWGVFLGARAHKNQLAEWMWSCALCIQHSARGMRSEHIRTLYREFMETKSNKSSHRSLGMEPSEDYCNYTYSSRCLCTIVALYTWAKAKVRSGSAAWQ